MYDFLSCLFQMARGHQKIQSQQKNAEKQAKMKKQQGHGAADQKKAALAALKASCAVCKVGDGETALKWGVQNLNCRKFACFRERG